jgi:hypothetical protein
MTTSYPIVAQYELGDPVKRGPMGVGKRREKDEIPKIKPHEVLVYRVGSKFVVDERELRAYHTMVVRASSVSVVSVQCGTEVEVSIKIDSQDASEFTVKVTFVCSVVDPVAVVRDGRVDAADALLAYLRGYQDLFDIGLKHPTSEINDVRTEAAFHVKAYMARRPPQIHGMDISVASVQVETPTVLADLGMLDRERSIELKKAESEALLDSQRFNHQLKKTAELDDAIGDPKRAIHLAHADGGLSGQEHADRLQQLDEQRQQREQADRLADKMRQSAIEDRNAQWAYDDRKAEVEWQREQREIERREIQQRHRDETEANIKLLQMFAERGHLDTHYEDIGDLIKQIRGEVRAVADGADASQAALPQGAEPTSAGPEDDDVS